MFPLAFALASGEPPPTELVAVTFSADARAVAVETRWVMDGPGFPVARLALYDTATGALAAPFEVTLREADAARGLDGATQAVRSAAAAALATAGIDLSRPTVAEPCDGNRCGGATGCADRGVPVVLSTTAVSGETCPAGWTGEALAVKVAGVSWAVTAERSACARGFAAEGFYRSGKAGVLVVGFSVPGHEGPASRFLPVVGPLP